MNKAQNTAAGFLVKSLASLLSKKQMLNKAALMTGAKVLGMGIGAAGTIYAARCLGPRSLGLSGMVQNIAGQGMLATEFISTTVLIREYKNARDAGDRDRIVQAANGFWLLPGLVFSVLAALFLILKWVPGDYQTAGWFFIPLILLSSVQPDWIFQAEEKQQHQSLFALIQPLLMTGLYLIWFKPGAQASADLFVKSSAAAVMFFVYWRGIFKLSSLKGFFIRIDFFRDMRDLVLKSRWLFISAIAVYVYSTLEQPLLGWLFSVEELGKYRTASSATNAACSFFNLIPLILYPRFIEWRKRGEEVLWVRQLKLTALFSAGGGILALGGFWLIPLLYPYVFGPSFAGAAVPCALLLLSEIIVVISGLFSWGLLTDHTYDKFVSSTLIGTAVFSLATNLLFIPRFGMMGAALVHLASEILILGVFFGLAYRRIGNIRKKQV